MSSSIRRKPMHISSMTHHGIPSFSSSPVFDSVVALATITAGGGDVWSTHANSSQCQVIFSHLRFTTSPFKGRFSGRPKPRPAGSSPSVSLPLFQKKKFWRKVAHSFIRAESHSCHPASLSKHWKETWRTKPILWPGVIISSSTAGLMALLCHVFTLVSVEVTNRHTLAYSYNIWPLFRRTQICQFSSNRPKLFIPSLTTFCNVFLGRLLCLVPSILHLCTFDPIRIIFAFQMLKPSQSTVLSHQTHWQTAIQTILQVLHFLPFFESKSICPSPHAHFRSI